MAAGGISRPGWTQMIRSGLLGMTLTTKFKINRTSAIPNDGYGGLQAGSGCRVPGQGWKCKSHSWRPKISTTADLFKEAHLQHMPLQVTESKRLGMVCSSCSFPLPIFVLFQLSLFHGKFDLTT